MSHWCDCDPNVATRKIASKGNCAVAIVCSYSYLNYLYLWTLHILKGYTGCGKYRISCFILQGTSSFFFIWIVGFVHCRNLGFNICTIFHFCIAHCTIAQLHILGVDQDLGIAWLWWWWCAEAQWGLYLGIIVIVIVFILYLGIIVFL